LLDARGMRLHHFLLPALPALSLALAGGCVDNSADPSVSDDDTIEPDVAVRYGADYSFARPSASSLQSQGFSFVARYLSHTPSKDISKAEADALIANGIDVVLNWEASGTAVLDGYNQGVADAQAAKAEALAVGQPADRPIYFSIDFDASAAEQGTINGYYDGVASVIGRARTGAYGGYSQIKRLFDAGKISWGWQAYAWSYGQWDPRAQFRQIENGIDGGQLDKDEAVANDFGQWGHVAPPETGPAPGAPTEPTACGRIAAGHGLARGKAVHSCDGRFELAMQSDGNLVLYSSGTALWSSATNGKGGDVAVMQGDGNFVIYDTHSHAVFNTRTAGHDGASFSIQDDGNLVVYAGGGGGALWNSDTGGIPTKPTACGVIAAGHGLAVGETIESCDNAHRLVMQGDGNLVLYHGKSALWASKTVGSGARMLAMQGDGNLVAYGAEGTVAWQSHTSGHPGAHLAVQTDGNLVLYAGSTAIWNTKTAGK
jgi:hypothetical protein